MNTFCYSPESMLESVPNLQGNYPPTFPETLGDFWNMRSQIVDGLLEFYALEGRGNVMERRNIVARWAGYNDTKDGYIDPKDRWPFTGPIFQLFNLYCRRRNSTTISRNTGCFLELEFAG
ncbi:hypothetical protein ROZALSC1DRAFT_30885, partial [Rozella allomycis CSF55]